MRIEDLHVEDGVHTNLHIVPGNADLLGNVEGLFLQAVPVGNTLDERNQNMKSRMQCAAVLPEILDNVRALLWDHSCGPRDNNHGDNSKRNEYVGRVHVAVRGC